MKFYINGIEKTKAEMKLEYYKEQYRFELIKLFIVKFFRKYGYSYIIRPILYISLGIILYTSIQSNTEAFDNSKFLNNMNLSECRITQNEDSHIQKGNGSMYAYDIACIRGRTFEVFAPNYKDIYVVKYIGYDSRIGNYITIKHGYLYFMYGHTKTDLKVGDRIKPGQKIGITDKSGYSQNYHLHLELWEGTENISFIYVEGKGSIKAEKSFEIREQRNWISGKEINTQILDFIGQPGMEGLSLTTYWDINHWANGYGTHAKYKGEVITKEIAILRARIFIQGIRDKYELHNYSINVQKAVVSFVYNIGSLDSDQIWLLENGFYPALGNNFKLYNGYYKDGEKIVLGGLVKRRTAEDDLLKGKL